MIYKTLPSFLFLCALLLPSVLPAFADNVVFPPDAGIVNVKLPPYNAKGDGIHDDTAAIQRALDDHPAMNAIIYLPNGTYLITSTLKWGGGAQGHTRQRNTILQGQNRLRTTIRLKNACPGYTDSQKPKAMIWTGEFPAQRFRNAIRNLTVHSGNGNPGAIGVQFHASNVGCVREVTIQSGDGQGVIGLDMSYTDDIGPCFIKNLAVIGFDVGIALDHGVNSMHFEHIRLRGQRKYGLVNGERVCGQSVGIRGLVSENSVPAVYNPHPFGLIALIDSRLMGTEQASARPAICSPRGHLFLRNVATPGYGRAVEYGDREPLRILPGPTVREFTTATIPGSAPASLNLPVVETPVVPWDDLKDWANIVDFGGKPDDDLDDSDALQRAIDSGKTTVCMPRGVLTIKKPIMIRGNVRRLIGCESYLKFPEPISGKSIFTVTNGKYPVVVVERLWAPFWENRSGINFIDNVSRRTLVLKEVGDVDNLANLAEGNVITGPGDLFIEDVTGRFQFRGQRVWARYINPETNSERNPRLEDRWHLKNAGGTLWILGIKTEGPGPIVISTKGAKTEVIGGLMYSSGGTAGMQDQPAFVVEDSLLSFTLSETNFVLNNPYEILVRQIRGGRVAFELKRGQTPSSPGGSLIPLFATR